MSTIMMFVLLLVIQQYVCYAENESCPETRARTEDEHALGRYIPVCTPNGEYQGIQYQGSGTFCVTTTGTKIPGYSVPIWEIHADLSCQCARDQFAYRRTGQVGKIFNCEQDGNYAPIGCTGSVCYCQNNRGKQIGAPVPIAQIDTLNCRVYNAEPKK